MQRLGLVTLAVLALLGLVQASRNRLGLAHRAAPTKGPAAAQRHKHLEPAGGQKWELHLRNLGVLTCRPLSPALCPMTALAHRLHYLLFNRRMCCWVTMCRNPQPLESGCSLVPRCLDRWR